jgi:hypothetical protein
MIWQVCYWGNIEWFSIKEFTCLYEAIDFKVNREISSGRTKKWAIWQKGIENVRITSI